MAVFCTLSTASASRRKPYNHFIQPDPDQLLRVSIAYGFGRGRLKSVYQVLRGKDLETDHYSAEHREKQFKLLEEAQAQVLDLTNWHQFLSSLVGAGFRSGEMISSQNALLFAYAFYLIGRVRYSVPEHILQKTIGRWFFAISLTGRYTNSPESAMDADLNRIDSAKTCEDFVRILDEMLASVVSLKKVYIVVSTKEAAWAHVSG